MLPARHRMRSGDEFSRTVRRGARAGGEHVVTHVLTRSTHADAARVGFVVSKAVGNAVRRNLTKRRLRAIMSAQVTHLDGRDVVVRALPSAGVATYGELNSDVTRSLDRALAKSGGAR